MNIDKILEERKKTYGDYNKHKKAVVKIIEILSALNIDNEHSDDITPEESVDFFYLVTKLARYATDTSHKDSIIDIQGYAKLISNTDVEPEVSKVAEIIEISTIQILSQLPTMRTEKELSEMAVSIGVVRLPSGNYENKDAIKIATEFIKIDAKNRMKNNIEHKD